MKEVWNAVQGQARRQAEAEVREHAGWALALIYVLMLAVAGMVLGGCALRVREFARGERLTALGTGRPVVVLRVKMGRAGWMYECRQDDGTREWMYEHELEAVGE